MKDYIYIGIIAALFLVFFMLHIIQSSRISKLMKRNLSFALCLLDDNNNGFILNTMHGRESSYTYIKEIENGTAYSTLGEEEKQALQKAISSDED